MSETPALSVAFFDSDNALHTALRSGIGLLFDGREARPLDVAPEIDADGPAWRARAGDQVALELEPVLEPVEIDGTSVTVCRGSGSVSGRDVKGLATLTETRQPPAWDELDALRGITALFDERNAVLAVTRRFSGSAGHGEEATKAVIFSEGERLDVEDTRVSTVYDADGRQRTGGLEMWLPGEDWPRRAFGTATAGTSLQLEGLTVHAAVFGWRMEGRVGSGAYDLVLRDRPPVAA